MKTIIFISILVLLNFISFSQENQNLFIESLINNGESLEKFTDEDQVVLSIEPEDNEGNDFTGENPFFIKPLIDQVPFNQSDHENVEIRYWQSPDFLTLQ